MHTFFRFDRALQAIGPEPILRDAARQLVDQLDAIVANDVVDIALEERSSVQRVVHIGQYAEIAWRVQVPAPETCFDVL